MAQFRYRLQTLLDRKQRLKEDAQQSLATAQQRLRNEQEELEACRRKQEASADRLRCARAEMVSPAAVRGLSGELMWSRRAYVSRLRDEWDSASDTTAAQQLRVAEAEDQLAAARTELASASREVEVLERHRTRLERRFHEEAARRETSEQEEMANVMFLGRRKAT